MVEGLVSKLKKFTNVPVCVGFGISKAEHAAAIASARADGVIIGSKIVGIIEENLDNTDRCISETAAFVGKIRAALEKQAGGK
jgi:tryptophan synthase alpha chain